MLKVEEVRNFGKLGDAVPIPALTEIQTDSYKRFLQAEFEPERRRTRKVVKFPSAVTATLRTALLPGANPAGTSQTSPSSRVTWINPPSVAASSTSGSPTWAPGTTPSQWAPP